ALRVSLLGWFGFVFGRFDGQSGALSAYPSVFLTLMIALSSCAQDLRGRHIFPVHSALATPISVSVGRPDHSSVRFGTILSMQGLSSAPGPNSFSAGGGIASNSDPNQFRDTPPVNTVAYVGGGISTKD